MICSKCQTTNPTGARFCTNCGAALPLACPVCGTNLPGGAKFCSNCGHDLSTNPQPVPAPAQPEGSETHLQQFIPKELLAKLETARTGGTFQGERRIVTMLFCDVKESTAAAGRLDPEEWVEIINRAFEYMIRPVYQYEGTVVRLMGDGLLAFFGAPIAHEDDPQRAVLAGLEILQAIRAYHDVVEQRWGIDFNVRVGVNTGLVVVGAVGSDLRMEYTALGDAINLAARMEQTALPGTLQISEATHRLIAPLFEFEALEAIQVKGKSEPVMAYRVLGRKAQPGHLRGIAGLDAPMIGRDREMSLLQAAVGELRAGRGQIVSVTGEAGLGKSRLITELRRALTGPEIPLQWVEGRSHSYETSTPFAPFIDLLGRLLRLPPGARYQELKDRIGELWPEGAEGGAPFLSTLLGITPEGEELERVKYLEPPQLRGLIFARTAEFFEALATRQPLVLVFEDVHWIDPTSLDLLESLLLLTERVPLMILAAFRPRQMDPSWHFHMTAGRDFAARYTSVSLEPLQEAESRELLSRLLVIEDLPEKVRRLILERAEGNPFFVEEMIRSLLDAGLIVQENGHWRATHEIENISIPNTLIGVITSRLDRLPETARRVVQAAAVIGREFVFDILAGVLSGVEGSRERLHEEVEESLAELQKRELVRRKEGDQGALVFIFKHILTQEAAYSSILLSRRREMHSLVAQSFQHRQPEKAAEIARHFLEARQPSQAVPYLVQAGERAAHAYASAEAIEYYSKALENRDTVEDRLLIRRAYEGWGAVLSFAGRLPEAIETTQAMLSQAEEWDDIPMQVSALNKLAALLALRMGRFQEGDALLARASRLAHEFDIKNGIVENSIIRCQMCTAVADFDRLVEHMSEVVEIGRTTDVKEHIVMGLEHLASSLMFLTRVDEAWEKAQEALSAAREIGDREHEAWLLCTTIAYCLMCRRDLEAASEAAEEGVRISTRIGSLQTQVFGNWMLAEIARLRGEYERALDCGQRSLEAALPLEEYAPFMVVQPLGSLGLVYLEISRHFIDQVSKFHLHALKLLETPGGAAGGGTAWADLGFCALALGDLEMAENCFQKGLNQRAMFMNVERPRYLTGQALLALQRDQPGAALKLVSQANAYASERGMGYIAPTIDLAAGRVHAALGDWELAIEQFEQAESQAAEMQMRPVIWQARAGAAEALAKLGRLPEAEEQRAAARAMIAEIAGMFRDETLREGFLDGSLVRQHLQDRRS